MKNYIKEQLQASISVKVKIAESGEILSGIHEIAEKIIYALKNEKKILLFGNGGSASDAQHIAAEFVGRFEMERAALPAIALPCNISNITAIGNDYSFEKVYSRQIEALGTAGDIAFGISTSGNSGNVIEGFKMAKHKKLICIGFTGENKCRMDDVCDNIIHVPSKITARIQESHILIAHILCGLVDKAYIN